MPNQTSLEELRAADTNNISFVKTAITSFHGKSKFYCRECHEFVFVAFHYKGTSKSPYTGETIYWDFIEDELGHTLEDFSH